MLIHIQDDIVRLQHSGLLDRLLKDKTTKNNIMWATDAYAHYGRDYERNEEIHPHLITGENLDIIKTRARKEFEQQNQRTRKRAEVFTPMWVCRMMNDKLDEEWFGYPDVFFKKDEPIEEVRFFEKKRTWQDYVDSRRLEITCGEAPYLMSRYDVATGEIIPIEKRCGIFDRKLRVVSENASTENEWFKWAIRAVQATYGYEFQGDNVLIARINILCTFEDYLDARWNRKLTRQETEKIINIITWNIWQMDGLTYTIPFREAEPDFVQLSLFNDFEVDLTKASQPLSRVYDWRRNNSGTFEGIKKGENRMKFDFIIGNPPYQDETLGENKTFFPPIYHLFLDEAFKISEKVELIHPARFLFNAGYTPKSWNKKMLNDPHFKILYYEATVNNVFPNTNINGGIVISYHDNNIVFGAIEVFSDFEEMNAIRKKVCNRETFESLDRIVYSAYSYHLSSNIYDENPLLFGRLSKGHEYDLKSNILELMPEVFVEENGDGYIRVLGRKENNRTMLWVKSSYINGPDNLDKFKVFLAGADGAAGTIGKPVPARVIGKPILGEQNVGSTESFISIGAFETKIEAENLTKYIKTKFARTMLSILKVTQAITPQKWKFVPLQDFTPNSDIDWTKSIPEIDRQLYTKYGLDEAEIEFIETHVKEME